jgi:hypothetical protein
MLNSYFFMKVGFGNCLLRDAVESGRGGAPTFLWVGYGQHPIPQAEADVQNSAGAPLDLRYLERASRDESTRGRVRVLTFLNESLYVWRVIDRLRPISETEVESLVVRHADDGNAFAKFDLDVKKRDLGALRSELRSKALPVRLESVVSRVLLPACIDSLSVYRSLNSGTFRYLCPTKGPLAEGLHLPLLNPEPVPLLLAGEREWSEQPFACFVRRYLDWCLDPSATESFASTYGLTEADALSLATAVMSPSQLEVAAAMVVQSIGMTLDAGVGKGLDVVDVRASIRHRRHHADYAQHLARVKAALTGLMGASIAPGVDEALDQAGSLEIQCKNYELAADALEHPRLVVFTPTGPADGRRLSLAAVRAHVEKHAGGLPAFEDWLGLLQFAYTQPRATLGFSKEADSLVLR